MGLIKETEISQKLIFNALRKGITASGIKMIKINSCNQVLLLILQFTRSVITLFINEFEVFITLHHKCNARSLPQMVKSSQVQVRLHNSKFAIKHLKLIYSILDKFYMFPQISEPYIWYSVTSCIDG